MRSQEKKKKQNKKKKENPRLRGQGKDSQVDTMALTRLRETNWLKKKKKGKSP